MPADTRERLVRAARDLMHASSYAEVSIEDICTRADVRRGSLYHFFRSKDALGLAVLDTNWALVAAMLDEAFNAEVPPLERIDRFVHGFGAMLAMMREQWGATPGCPLGGLAAELSAHDGQARARVTGILDAWARYFTDAISDARARGDLGPTVDPAQAAVRILAYLQGMALLAKAYDQPDLVAQARTGVRMLLRTPA